jgi:hypothetical protein
LRLRRSWLSEPKELQRYLPEPLWHPRQPRQPQALVVKFGEEPEQCFHVPLVQLVPQKGFAQQKSPVSVQEA